eukprot:gene21317-22152_t
MSRSLQTKDLFGDVRSKDHSISGFQFHIPTAYGTNGAGLNWLRTKTGGLSMVVSSIISKKGDNGLWS